MNRIKEQETPPPLKTFLIMCASYFWCIITFSVTFSFIKMKKKTVKTIVDYFFFGFFLEAGVLKLNFDKTVMCLTGFNFNG